MLRLQQMQVKYAPDEPRLFSLQEKPDDLQFEPNARIKMVLGSPLYIRGPVVQFARKLEEELSLYLTTFDYLPFSFFFRKKKYPN